MSYTSCAAKIAASIQQDCERPLVGGYTGRAVIIPANDFARAEVVVSATNPREILSIILPPDGSVMPYSIDNVFQTPFSGSSTAGNADNGRNGYLKTLAVRIPMRGADVSKDVVEPLVKDPAGFVVIVEKRDKVGDGSFEVIGYQNSLRGDIASVTRDESANGGDWLMNLTTIESWAEIALVGAGENYATAKKNFDELLNFESIITRMVLTEYSGDEVQLSASGLVIVEYIQDGEKVRNAYSVLSGTFVPIPYGIEAIIYGAVSAINTDGIENVFASLDLSKSTALTYLDCIGCTGLTSLDVSKNTELTDLLCNGCTGLTSLDVSKNTELTNLNCENCTGLKSLDVSKNTKLTYFYCSGCTGLTSLDVSKNTTLADINCSGCTGLTSLDVSKNTELIHFYCNDCQNLLMLNIKNTAELNYGAFLDQSIANLTTLQVAGTSAWAYEQVESWLSDFAPNDGKLYVDENTPQGVITSAEAKNWEVIYQS